MGGEKKPEIRIRISLLIKRGNQICLVRHRKDDRRYWLLPGGGQEPFETAEDAAHRELAEETGIRITRTTFLFGRETMNMDLGRHILFLVFAGLDPDFSSVTPSRDPRVEGLDFATVEALTSMPLYPNMKDDIRNILADKPVPLFGSLPWVP